MKLIDREFRWNDWNRDKLHGLTIQEVEHLIRFAKPPYPERHKQDTWLVVGQLPNGQLARAVFFTDPEGTFYVIHAQPLSGKKQRRRARKRRKRR